MLIRMKFTGEKPEIGQLVAWAKKGTVKLVKRRSKRVIGIRYADYTPCKEDEIWVETTNLDMPQPQSAVIDLGVAGEDLQGGSAITQHADGKWYMVRK